MKVFGSSDSQPKSIENIIRQVWDKPDLEAFRHVFSNNGSFVYLVQFMNKKGMEEVIRKSPRTAMGMLLLVRKLEPFSLVENLVFSRGIIWLQIHQVPLPMVSKKNDVVELARATGDLIPETYNNCGLYARIKVEINVHKKLVMGTKTLYPNGEICMVIFQYEMAGRS